MNIRRFFAVMMLASAGCSSAPNMDDWQCACDGSITFALARPLPGPEISISVEDPEGTVERLDCQPTGGSLACLPLSSALVPNLDATGALQSVSLEHPARGAYVVELVVGGIPMGGGTFNFQGNTYTSGACGETTCVASETFTIGD